MCISKLPLSCPQEWYQLARQMLEKVPSWQWTFLSLKQKRIFIAVHLFIKEFSKFQVNTYSPVYFSMEVILLKQIISMNAKVFTAVLLRTDGFRDIMLFCCGHSS